MIDQNQEVNLVNKDSSVIVLSVIVSILVLTAMYLINDNIRLSGENVNLRYDISILQAKSEKSELTDYELKDRLLKVESVIPQVHAGINEIKSILLNNKR